MTFIGLYTLYFFADIKSLVMDFLSPEDDEDLEKIMEMKLSNTELEATEDGPTPTGETIPAESETKTEGE